MKIKGPQIPVLPSAKDGAPKAEIKNRSNQVANALAGLMGTKDEILRKEKKEKSKELQSKDDQKKLREAGKKWGIQKEDSPKEATKKIVLGVLGREYNAKEKGFDQMVQEITSFIQEQNPELKAKFNHWIAVMQSEI